jgi:serine/threonine-protein kinase
MSEITSRLSTALADRYRIERRLGEGGMATVYLAEDLRHERKVALKVLKAELAAVLGAERFVQEIKTTASLQHPNILPLFDSGEADSFLYYVMPFIEGETLREKLNRETQLSIDQAVQITTDVAEALQAAHEEGVIHRDIKPENVLLHKGRAMVADFGIALAVSAAAGGRMTETGLSLGTPHYMSPEQATAEKDITARSDIYSLGTVLYEMLTGEPPHMGNSAQQIIMKIVTEDAQPVTKLRKSVPPNVTAAVSKALEKLAADRFESAAQFAEALTNPAFALPSRPGTQVVGTAGPWQWNRLTATLTAVAALATIFGVSSWLRPGPAPAHVVRYAMAFPEGEAITGWHKRIALSPDGTRLAYIGEAPDGARQLWIRQRDQLNATPLPDTRWPESPFFSPDGEQVGFFKPRGTIRTVPVGGGTPATLTNSLVGYAGASWGPNGNVYADGEGFSGLVRVSPGGTSEPFTTVDTARGEVDHIWPEVLPGGEGVLFVVLSPDVAPFVNIAVADVATGHHEVLVQGRYAQYVASGHLLYVVGSSLMAQRFDPKRLSLSGEAVRVVEGLWSAAIAAPMFVPEMTVSATGTLMYTSPTGLPDSRELVWITRDGTVEALDPAWTDRISTQGLDLSPDGSRLAVVHGGEIHVKNLPRGSVSKLTFEGGVRPTWTPDGRAVIFADNRTGIRQTYRRNADGTGQAELFLEEPEQIHDLRISADGLWAVYRIGGGGNSDLYARRLDEDGERIPLVVTPDQEAQPALSPDGRWLAYTSLGSGRPEVWVRPFPNTGDGEWRVSAAGYEPLWAHSGRELFFRSAGEEMMSVPITESATTFVYEDPQPLFSTRDYHSYLYTKMYDVTPDDQRFVMLRRITKPKQLELIVVENFFEELKAMVGH